MPFHALNLLCWVGSNFSNISSNATLTCHSDMQVMRADSIHVGISVHILHGAVVPRHTR